MSHSPTQASTFDDAYSKGWEALFQLLYSGGSLSGRERNCCFLNRGDSSFNDISAVAGFDFDDDGRALGKVDWDQDGRMDVWMVNRTAPRARFLRNVSDSKNGFLAFHLRGVNCNRDAIGARVTVRLENSNKVLTQSLRAGEGYLSQSSKWLHFGMGSDVEISEVRVRWPGAETEESFKDVQVNGRFDLVQGTGQAIKCAKPSVRIPFDSSKLASNVETQASRIVLAGRVPIPEIQYLNQDQRSEVWKPSNRPTLFCIWANWCVPCVSELRQFAQDDSLHEIADIIPLSGDEAENRAKAIQILNDMDWSHNNGFAPPETLDLLDRIQQSLLSNKQQMPIPTSFLIDQQGRLAVIYKGVVKLEQLKQDIELCSADEEMIWRKAVPFSGQWFERPNAAAHAQMAIATGLIKNGDTKLASWYLEGLTNQVDPSTLAEGAESRMTFAGAQLNLAAKLYEKGDAGQAIELIRNALDFSPGFAKAHYNLGVIFQNQGDYKAAKAELMNVLKTEPNHALANFNLGAMIGSTDPAAAKSYYLRAISSDPQLTDARYNLGLLELSAGRMDAAEQQFNAVLNLGPHAPSFFQMGNIHLARNEAELAVSDYRAAIEFSPEHLGARTNLGAILISTNRAKESVAHFRYVAERRPDGTASSFNYALALLQAEDPLKAKDIMERLIEKDPDFPLLRLRLAQAMILSTSDPVQLDNAIKLAKESIQQDPKTSELATQLIHQAQSKIQQAE